MKGNKDEQGTSISKARTLEEIADFWDTTAWLTIGMKRTKLILRYGCSRGAV